jgi:hypothetical protein
VTRPFRTAQTLRPSCTKRHMLKQLSLADHEANGNKYHLISHDLPLLCGADRASAPGPLTSTLGSSSTNRIRFTGAMSVQSEVEECRLRPRELRSRTASCFDAFVPSRHVRSKGADPFVYRPLFTATLGFDAYATGPTASTHPRGTNTPRDSRRDSFSAAAARSIQSY